MKIIILAFLCLGLTISCQNKKENQLTNADKIIGTWKLLTGTTITQTDTSIVDYTKDQKLIKIITPTHFSFLRHDLNNGKDSSAIFVAGGGKAKITNDTYIEYLQFCNFRDWENGTFEFEYTIKNDTLTIKGVEKIEKLGVNHLTIESYIREQ
ncbi:hypothetical protein [Flavobacterium sp. J27]|uniref:hypothetical protein n=1 Tax=Flavobacterium sp. J27 TaxID=2060419 RepID=UPI00102F37C3|nr:hypothetical protein [Flavobacterium sp. J27]